MLFSEIPGLEDIKKTLIHSVTSNHVHHAQLFMGTEGTANLALAIAYATYINCEDKQPEDSCGKCPSCLKFKKLAHPDINFVFPISTTKQIPKDPASSLFMKEWRNFVLENPYGTVNEWGNFIGAENKQLNISVDESRNIIKTLALKAYEAEYKIMFIWHPENMHVSAANAILKILEEPPVKTVFLLITNNSEKLLTTILSRTQKIKIKPFSEEEIRQYLIGKFQLDEKKAGQLAYLADGSMNEALRLQKEVEEDHHIFFRDWMRICYKKNNLQELVEWTETFQKLGREVQKTLIHYGLNILRETLIYSASNGTLVRLGAEDLKFVEGFSKVLSEEKVERICAKLNEVYYHIERNANPKIAFLDVSLMISQIFKS